MLSVDARRAILADVALEQLLRANARARRVMDECKAASVPMPPRQP